MNKYTEAIQGDNVVILCDGIPMGVGEILAALNAAAPPADAALADELDALAEKQYAAFGVTKTPDLLRKAAAALRARQEVAVPTPIYTQTELLREAVELLRPFAELAQDHQKLRGDNDPLFGINKATVLHGDVRKARAFLAKIDAAKGEESEFQVISGADEDACIEAATSGPRDVALREAMRYAHQYAEDGPVKVVELVTVAMLAASGRQDGAR